MEKLYRTDITEIPRRILSLPVDRGYPVPWFVKVINNKFDFRVTDEDKLIYAIQEKVCWICGQRLGSSLAFVVGPIGFINMTTPEPPSHKECAEFAMRVCPFLCQLQVKYNSANLPEGVEKGPDLLDRQPGIMGILYTKSYTVNIKAKLLMLDISTVDSIVWYREGKLASKENVDLYFNKGVNILRQLSRTDKHPLEKVKVEDRIRIALSIINRPKRRLFGSAAKES